MGSQMPYRSSGDKFHNCVKWYELLADHRSKLRTSPSEERNFVVSLGVPRDGRDFLDLLDISGASLANSVGDAGGQIVRLRPASGLSIDTHSILGTTGTSETATLVVSRLQRLDLGLETSRGLQLALGIVSLEDRAIVDLNAHKPGGQIGIGTQPLLGGPALVSEDSLDKEHIGQGVTDSLVDQIGQSLKAFQGTLLSRRLRLGVLDHLERIIGEGDGAMSVGLEVDTDIKAKGSVVKVLHTCVGANDGKLQYLLNVVGTRAVSVGGLNDTNLEIMGNTGATSQVTNERSSKSGNAVTVE